MSQYHSGSRIGQVTYTRLQKRVIKGGLTVILHHLLEIHRLSFWLKVKSISSCLTGVLWKRSLLLVSTLFQQSNPCGFWEFSLSCSFLNVYIMLIKSFLKKGVYFQFTEGWLTGNRLSHFEFLYRVVFLDMNGRVKLKRTMRFCWWVMSKF